MVSTLSAPTGERTGIVHTTSRLVDPALLAFSHFLNVANPEFSQTQTGQDIKAQTDVQPDFVEYVPVESLNITGSELPAGNILFVFFDDVAGRSVTSYRVSISSKRLFPETPYQEGSQGFRTHFSVPLRIHKRSVPNPAARLREISGLDVGRLAEIFRISRPAYHKWLSNSIPHNMHREHLLEVLSLLEEAAQRIGSPKNVADWLLTPIAANGTRPIDYLKAQKYMTFRGFLLSVRTGNEIIKPLNSSSLIRKELPREEMEDEIESLSPRTLLSDELDAYDLD